MGNITIDAHSRTIHFDAELTAVGEVIRLLSYLSEQDIPEGGYPLCWVTFGDAPLEKTIHLRPALGWTVMAGADIYTHEDSILMETRSLELAKAP